ncbi:hypothetical protein [Ectopseudomonas khazarica]|uniref:hypothetical protein n=1 Tax=Ectopseudomonas khazarica TaxID=2502979 RepID=UPI003B9625A5
MATQDKANANMALWNSVQATDKAFTVTQNFDGRDITTINGTYVARRATEVFGPIGKGWGFEILVDRFDQGAPITTGSGADFKVYAYEIVHTVQLKLWYLRGGKKNYITQYGHTPFVRKGQYGPYTDFDAPKKSVTDAMKKCLSLAGFSADVHMGMFDDPTYMYGMEIKERLDAAGEDSNQEVMREARVEFREWLDRQVNAIVRSPNERALNLLAKNLLEQAREKAKVVKYDPADVERHINEAVEQRKQWLIDNPTQPARPLQKANEE